MNNLGTYVLLLFISGILLFALIRRTAIFDCFLEGAKDGMQNAISILPALIALLFAVKLLTASGITEALTHILSPLLKKIGFPAEVLPLCILSPLSGSGSLSAFQDILATFGADSYIGRVASVIAGATETTFYAVTVYYGAIGVKKIRHTIAAALCADISGFIFASLFVRLFFD